jgi:hypothetical protein
MGLLGAPLPGSSQWTARNWDSLETAPRPNLYPLVNIQKAIENGLFIVDFPIKNMVIFHSYVNVYQRVKSHSIVPIYPNCVMATLADLPLQWLTVWLILTRGLWPCYQWLRMGWMYHHLSLNQSCGPCSNPGQGTEGPQGREGPRDVWMLWEYVWVCSGVVW